MVSRRHRMRPTLRAEAWLSERRRRFAACPHLTGLGLLLVLAGTLVGVPALDAWWSAEGFDGSALAMALAFALYVLGLGALLAVDQEW